jgi:hypothetical protein
VETCKLRETSVERVGTHRGNHGRAFFTFCVISPVAREDRRVTLTCEDTRAHVASKFLSHMFPILLTPWSSE